MNVASDNNYQAQTCNCLLIVRVKLLSNVENSLSRFFIQVMSFSSFKHYKRTLDAAIFLEM
jgi:hypothetical protein